jgi:hypothetical protein
VGRTRDTGQFSCFGPRSCFIAFALDIPNGFWPLNRAVGRACIRTYYYYYLLPATWELRGLLLAAIVYRLYIELLGGGGRSGSR